MTSKRFLFTSESVTEGHPDKVCDQISDAILDEFLTKDQSSRVAAETTVTTGMALVCGEITSDCYVDIPQVVRNTIKNIGYVGEEGGGFDYKTCAVLTSIDEQSTDIAGGVNKALESRSDNADTSKSETENVGAGDQGIMFGYATNETKGFMPLAISIAHKLVRVASNLRKEGKFKYARPDMKAQVTIDYSDSNNPTIDTVLMSVQHDGDYNEREFKQYIHDEIMVKVVKSFGFAENFDYLINPTGKFEIGGPKGDVGLTGRKIIVDTYGGSARHGGGAFSGKDPSKVDRTAAYYARYIAKNLVAAGVADRLEVQLAYAIGVAEPVSISISTFKTSHYSDEIILDVINKFFDCRPGKIIEQFSMLEPKFNYRDISNYGHFGRSDLNLPWEELDKVEDIKAYLN